jgi:serine/threonine protein kinase
VRAKLRLQTARRSVPSTIGHDGHHDWQQLEAGRGRLVIGEKLGFGGFGTVFKAQHTRPSGAKFDVVVKVPHAEVTADPVLSKKFAREARILNIDHPNVVRIIAHWTFPDGDQAIVQEQVVDAMPLTAYVTSSREAAPSLLLQALHGLCAFHKGSNVVHRDITPNNLLVNGKGLLKVIDFRLAREDPRTTTTLTRIGIGMGTSGCIAPEQLTDAANVDHRADLYGLGKAFAAAIQARDPQHVEVHRLPEPWRSLCTLLPAPGADGGQPAPLLGDARRQAGHRRRDR